MPTTHVHIKKRQVEFHDTGADAKTPTRIYRVGEAFNIAGVPMRVAAHFEVGPT